MPVRSRSAQGVAIESHHSKAARTEALQLLMLVAIGVALGLIAVFIARY